MVLIPLGSTDAYLAGRPFFFDLQWFDSAVPYASVVGNIGWFAVTAACTTTISYFPGDETNSMAASCVLLLCLQVTLHGSSESGSGVDFYRAVLDEKGNPRRLAVKRMPWNIINKKLGKVREVSYNYNHPTPVVPTRFCPKRKRAVRVKVKRYSFAARAVWSGNPTPKPCLYA